MQQIATKIVNLVNAEIFKDRKGLKAFSKPFNRYKPTGVKSSNSGFGTALS